MQTSDAPGQFQTFAVRPQLLKEGKTSTRLVRTDHFGLRDLHELPNAEELRTRHLPTAPRSQSESAEPRPTTPAALT